MRLKEGEKAPMFDIEDIYGKHIALKNLKGKKLMISFYRFSECPFCNLRVADLIQHYPDFEKQGLKMISFWQSTKEEILETVGTQHAPFPLIPDKQKKIYTLYGVENHFMAPWKVLLDLALSLRVLFSPFMKMKIAGEIDLVPADFLINSDGTIYRAYYGKHVGDHLPISEIESFIIIN
jgi:thioredoxin-dependent peroxiredoxin